MNFLRALFGWLFEDMPELHYGDIVRVSGGVLDGWEGKVCSRVGNDYLISFYDVSHDLNSPAAEHIHRRRLILPIVIDGTVKDAPFEIEPATCLVEYQ